MIYYKNVIDERGRTTDLIEDFQEEKIYEESQEKKLIRRNKSTHVAFYIYNHLFKSFLCLNINK